jgi:mono/diheme cytochrome c family protein
MTNTQGADAPFLFDCYWIFGGSDQQIFHTITHGVPGTRMVSFEGAIPDADIWRIVAYLKSASQCKK